MIKMELLGASCPNCKKLAQRAIQAAADLRLEFELVEVNDIQEILSRGVLTTPALLINGHLRVLGKIPGLDHMKRLLTEFSGGEGPR